LQPKAPLVTSNDKLFLFYLPFNTKKIMEDILAIVGVFFVPFAALLLILWFYFRHIRRRNELKAELYSKSLEKGVELPKELFGAAPSKNTWLILGVTLAALGLGLILAFSLLACIEGSVKVLGAGIFGLIPLMLGLGFLAIHIISRRLQGGQS
jgi:purine-cytosine permease-like protein